MPTYNFVDDETGETFEMVLSMGDREDFLESNPTFRQLPPDRMNIISGHTYAGLKNDGGFNDQMSRIAEAHPTSAVANQYGDKSARAVKTRQAVEKWRKKRSADN